MVILGTGLTALLCKPMFAVCGLVRAMAGTQACVQWVTAAKASAAAGWAGKGGGRLALCCSTTVVLFWAGKGRGRLALCCSTTVVLPPCLLLWSPSWPSTHCPVLSP